MDIDLVRLNLNQNSINILNGIISIIMFGVALNLKVSDFIQLLKKPISLISGVLGFYLIFPLLTYAMILAMDLRPSLALGLVVVAACPAGNLANIFTNLSRGNTALSVGLVSLTTLLSTISIPFTLMLLGSNVEGAGGILTEIKLDTVEIFKGVFFMLAIPLIIGMTVASYFPKFSEKAHKILNKVSFLFLILFVAGALSANFDHFLNYFFEILQLVLLQTFIALLLGFILGTFISKDHKSALALSYFMGVRNTALGLLLVFQFFGGLGGMALVVAFYGISQITIGILLGQIWKKINIQKEAV